MWRYSCIFVCTVSVTHLVLIIQKSTLKKSRGESNTLLLPYISSKQVIHSVVGVATCYRLDGWDQIPVVARFSVPIQTSPENASASCAMGNGSFLGIKQPE